MHWLALFSAWWQDRKRSQLDFRWWQEVFGSVCAAYCNVCKVGNQKKHTQGFWQCFYTHVRCFNGGEFPLYSPRNVICSRLQSLMIQKFVSFDILYNIYIYYIYIQIAARHSNYQCPVFWTLLGSAIRNGFFAPSAMKLGNERGGYVLYNSHIF